MTKPVVGVFDLASNVSEGIRNMAGLTDKSLDRVRMPRHIGGDGILKPYNGRNAVGAYWLKLAEAGRFEDEHYAAHMGRRGCVSAVMERIKSRC